MNAAAQGSKAAQLQQLSGILLQRAWVDERKGNVLLIIPAHWPTPVLPGLHSDLHSFGLTVNIRQGPSQRAAETNPMIECFSSALPFQDDVFREVALLHVTADGSEPELGEACRVLAPGGELLVLGLNRSSWCGRFRHRHGPFPRLAIAQVRTQLHRHDMSIQGILGAGLMGQPGPAIGQFGLGSLVRYWADLVVLRARHRGGPALTRLRVKELPAGVVPTALNSY